jgi:hypothetical protein
MGSLGPFMLLTSDMYDALLELDSVRLPSLPGRKMKLKRIIAALPTKPVSASPFSPCTQPTLPSHIFPDTPWQITTYDNSARHNLGRPGSRERAGAGSAPKGAKLMAVSRQRNPVMRLQLR